MALIFCRKSAGYLSSKVVCRTDIGMSKPESQLVNNHPLLPGCKVESPPSRCAAGEGALAARRVGELPLGYATIPSPGKERGIFARENGACRGAENLEGGVA